MASGHGGLRGGIGDSMGGRLLQGIASPAHPALATVVHGAGGELQDLQME